MAITSSDTSCDKVPSKSSGSVNSSKHSCQLHKLHFGADSSISSAASKCSKPKINNSKSRSPYLTGDRIQLLSRVVEKRFVHKTNIVSSFPLAANLYKTNSDDFKSLKKATKKVKKSVLTLPNDPAPVPQVCTVSDMNESEYCDKNDEDRKRKVVKKRAPIQNNRKGRVREKDFEFYDRDAQYCSQLNIDLDCSSTDMMKNFNGDSKRLSNRKKILPNSNKTHTASKELSDVWAVLRNINRFQFRPSPPMSEESIVPVKRKVQKRPKKANRKDARVIGTCRTQEFAYISSYELDKKSASNLSPSSSIDRITVIDNQGEFNIICEEFEKRLLGTQDFLKDSNNSKNLIQKNKILSKSLKKNVTALANSGAKDNKQLIPMKKKKKNNLKPPVVEQSTSEMTDNSNGNRDSLIGTEILQYNDNSDILLHKTENDSIFPAKASYIGSDYSGSSKAELPNKIDEQVSRYDKYLDIAVINKEHEGIGNITKRLDPQQRKPRLVTTMPSSCMIPKLTQNEIKRRLAHMRFPIVVLGKDQVSSSIQVMDYDPPQFNGLDDHIWPFMIEWSPNAPIDTKHHNNTLSRTCQSYLDSNSASQIKSKPRKPTIEVGLSKQAALKYKKQDSTTVKNNPIVTPTRLSEITDKIIQCTKKQKSIVKLKDKMLNFLYKKSSNRDVNNASYEKDESKPMTLNGNSVMAENKITAITDSQLKPDNVLNDPPLKKPYSIEGNNKKAPIYKHPWAKAKWASDFIDNVMNKIRSGVYYSQDLKDFCQTYQIDLQEVSVQAELYSNSSLTHSAVSTQTYDSEADSTHDRTNDIHQNNRTSIPGFNNVLPLLEIQTLNMSQITVKHCMTNIMVQFDISIPAKTKTDKSTRGLNKTLSLTPIAITESQTKVYKCKTSIFNAMLPAELCSILPKMMSRIINSNNSSIESPAACLTKTDSCLSTITELTRYEHSDAPIPTSPEIKHILEGRFSNIVYKKPRVNQIDYQIKYDQCLVTEMLPIVSLDNLYKYKASALVLELDNSQYKHSQASLHQSNKQISGVTDTQNRTSCTAVQIYTGSKKILTSAFKPNQLMGMIESIMCSHNLLINQNLNSYFDMLKRQYNGKNVEINMSLTNDNGVQKNISVTVSNLNIDSLYKAIPKIKNDKKYEINRNNTPLQSIEYVNTSIERKSQVKKLTQVKRKGFYKVYRKCKSINKPSGEKLTSTANTPLNKITTLDDFFQILGSKKIFSSVFDGNVAKNILSSLMEMKNWITEINPKQALLVLLLTNKKDTQNLVRFRPIILQGIAVNRITRASELDMEIEVIDREKFKPFPQQFEGITYLSGSPTDYENLLDELYWIAKTTASDYNRPFDESSVRLLKSLLQKRKKLNPSYLRVMARYVGLGLVKTPTC